MKRLFFAFLLLCGVSYAGTFPGVPASAVMQDDFTGTNGISLTAHSTTAPTDGAWVQSTSGANQTMQLTGDGHNRQATGNANNYNYLLYSIDTPTLYQTITYKVLAYDNSVNWGTVIQMYPTAAGGDSNGSWLKTLAQSGTSGIYDNGGVPRCAGSPSWTYSNGDTLWQRIVFDGKVTFYKSTDGSSFTELCHINRNDILSVLSTTWRGVGRSGIMGYGSGGAGTGVWGDDITVTRGVPNPAYSLFICGGSSIAAGVGTTTPYTDSICAQWLAAQSNTNLVMSDTGIASQDTVEMATYEPVKVAALAQPGYKTVMYFLDGGAVGNDYANNGSNAATALAHVHTLLNNIKNGLPAGVTPVFGMGQVLPRGSWSPQANTGNTDFKDPFNTLCPPVTCSELKSNGGLLDFVYVPPASILADSANPAGGPNGVNYNADLIHPNSTGANIYGVNLKPVTDPFFP